jgi:CRISPR-associated endonuclease/helicase Cas3
MILPNKSSAERYAHTLPGRPPADWETLADHLNKVKDSASTFAEAFGARVWGEVLGRCHDLGKFSDEFQAYLQKSWAESADAGSEEEGPRGGRVDHSTFGARFVAQAVGKVSGQLLAFCIAGHHTGLPDETSADDATQRSTLRYKLEREKYPIPEVAAPVVILPTLISPLKLTTAGRADVPFQLAFFTRMLFSCLIDADRTRTEEFCDPEKALVRGGLGPVWAACKRSRKTQRRRKSIVSGQLCLSTVAMPRAYRQASFHSTFPLAAARPYRRWPLHSVMR